MIRKKIWLVLGVCLMALSMTAMDCYGPRAMPGPDFWAKIAQPHPEWSPDGSMIFFAYWKDLYSVRLDTGDLHFITSEKERIVSPALSPDGSQIAYTSLRKGPFWNPGEHWEIRVIGIDGSSKRTLGRSGIKGRNQPYDINPAWSPDGKRIAFVSSRPEHVRGSPYHVYLMERDGTNVRRVTLSAASPAARPNWSPDGTQLAFVGRTEDFPTDQHEYAHVVDLDSDRLTNLGRTWTAPEWSPDGTRVALVGWDGTNRLVVSTTPDGSDSRNITEVSVYAPHYAPFEYLSWFPDSMKLFLSIHGGVASDYTTYIIDPTQADPSGDRFRTNLFADGVPSWSPDGTLVAMYSVRKHFLYTILPDGSGSKRLAARGEDRPITAAEWQELEKTKAASTPNP